MKNKINNQITIFYYTTEPNTLSISFDTNRNDISCTGKIKSNSILTIENIKIKPDTLHKMQSIKKLEKQEKIKSIRTSSDTDFPINGFAPTDIK